MKLDDYLMQFGDLKALYQLVKQDFSTRGLIHHNWHHILRDLARAIVIGEAEKAKMKIVLASVLLHARAKATHTSRNMSHKVNGVPSAGPRII